MDYPYYYVSIITINLLLINSFIVKPNTIYGGLFPSSVSRYFMINVLTFKGFAFDFCAFMG